MYSFKRADRVKELMLEEISDIIRNKVKDPRIGFVTVTDVDLAGNLQSARVLISPMGSETEQKNTYRGICSAAGFIRKELGKRLRIKYLPELSFKWDHGPEHSDKINRLFHEMEMEDKEKGSTETENKG